MTPAQLLAPYEEPLRRYIVPPEDYGWGAPEFPESILFRLMGAPQEFWNSPYGRDIFRLLPDVLRAASEFSQQDIEVTVNPTPALISHIFGNWAVGRSYAEFHAPIDASGPATIGIILLSLGAGSIAVEGGVAVEAGGAATEVGAVEGAVVGGTAGEVGVAVGAAGGVAGSVEGSATAAVGGAQAAVGEAGNSIFGSITSTIGELRDSLRDIITPIADTVHTVSDLVKDINDNLIKPITGPITSILENYKSLSEQLTRDLHAGVGGLLRIPQDIGNALTSIDATMQRTVSMLGAANAATIRAELGPGVGTGVLMGVERTRAELGAGLDAYTSDERDHQIRHLHEDPSIEALDRVAEKILAILKGEYGWAGKLAGAVIDVFMMIPHLLLFQAPKTRHYEQLGNEKWPTQILDAATALAALSRGILPEGEAEKELAKAGFNPDRIAVLKELDRKMPSESMLLEWEARGFIGADNLADALKALSWRDDDAARIREGFKKLPDVATAIRWRRRGIIGTDEMQQILQANGLRFADHLRYVEDDAKQPGAGDVLAYIDRRAAISANVAPQSLNTLPEQSVLDELAALGIPERTAALLWVNHFILLDPASAAQAWFRGYLSETQRNACYQAAGLVPEQWQNFTDLQRPLFTARNVPTLLGAKIINAQEAMDILRRVGYEDVDADRMVRYSLQKVKPDTVVQADALHGLASGTVVSLYDAGALTREEATAHLIEMGLSIEAAQLTLLLRDVRNQADERAAEADLIIARARSGGLTYDEAQAALAQVGLSTTEIAKAMQALERVLNAKTKLPSEAQLFGLLKKELLSRSAVAETLGLLGYSEAWAELVIQLNEG